MNRRDSSYYNSIYKSPFVKKKWYRHSIRKVYLEEADGESGDVFCFPMIVQATKLHALQSLLLANSQAFHVGLKIQ